MANIRRIKPAVELAIPLFLIARESMHCSIAVQYLIHGLGNQSRGIQFAPDICRGEPFLDTDMRIAN